MLFSGALMASPGMGWRFTGAGVHASLSSTFFACIITSAGFIMIIGSGAMMFIGSLALVTRGSALRQLRHLYCAYICSML